MLTQPVNIWLQVGLKISGAIGVAILVVACTYHYLFPKGKIINRTKITLLDESSLDHRLVAQTDTGKVLGYRHPKGVLRYSSIPFAAPPVGKQRFQPPQPISPWSGVLDTRKPGPSCIQRVTKDNEASLHTQSEDCLSLTVTTPNLDNAKRPVIVWLHGGGLTAGGNHHSTYDGANFSARGDVVFVNVQYRLGILGWLDVSSLGEDDVQQSSQTGQLDVIAGLDWVQRNITQFGGDPNNVTLMGESAGSHLAVSLLLHAEAQSLFDKVILQSGVHSVWQIPVDRHELLQLVLKQANVDSLAGLRQVDAKTIQNIETQIKQFALSKGLADPMPWYSIRGITNQDFERAAHNGKPVLHGTLKDEYHLFILSYSGQAPHRQFADAYLGGLGLDSSQIDTLVTQIKQSLPHRQEHDLLVDLASAIHMHYPHSIVSEQYGAIAPVYTYLIDWAAPNFPELGAMHGLDLPLVFGNFDAWSWALGRTPPQPLSNDIQDAWIAFARTGNPNHDNLPTWPVYDKENRSTMQFGDTYQVISDPLEWVRGVGATIDNLPQFTMGNTMTP